MAKMDKDGNWIDARGAMFPPNLISESDKRRDSFVEKKIQKARKLAMQLADFRKECASDMEKLLAELAKDKRVRKLRQNWRGNIGLCNFDDSLVVERAINDLVEFDESLQLAKAQIDEWLNKRLGTTDPALTAVISQAFSLNKKGKINTAMLLKLIGLEIDDPDWQKAMKILKESLTVKATKTYFRFKEKVTVEGVETWKNISLNFADAGEGE